MTADDRNAAAMRGIEMEEAAVSAFLEDQGHGVLALAGGKGAYGVPVSFGYDGEAVYLALLRFGDASEKLEAVESTDNASLVAYDVEDRYHWRSVVVRGALEPVDVAAVDAMDDAMEANAWFPNIYPPTEPVTGVQRYAMAVDDATGRVGPGYGD